MDCDISIIGSGLMGSAIAQNLSKYDLDIVVIEKTEDVCSGSSKATSAIIHTGFDEKPGTLKAQLIREGSQMMEGLCIQLDVPYRCLGHLVVARSEDELNKLNLLKIQGDKNNIKDIELLDKKDLLALEPGLAKDVAGALYAKNGAIVSPYELAIALMENAQKNGVKLMLNASVMNIKKEDRNWVISTPRGTIRSKYIINASGTSVDEISNMIGDREFNITPIKGEEYILDRNVGDIINHIIVVMSTGVIALPTVHDNLLVGTTAVRTDKGDTYTTETGYEYIFSNIKKVVPAISERDVITSFAGLRAMNDKTDDYIVKTSDIATNFLNVSISSPGVTATPAVAIMVESMLQDSAGLSFVKKAEYDPSRKAITKFKELSEEEKGAIIEKDSKYGHVICRCETITEGEIVEAIRRGARTLDGIKYRVRAGMGRCQGGFCTPRILRILERELGYSITEVTKKGKESEIVYHKQKDL